MANAKKIAVLGGGSGAHAMAADLTLKELEVNICEAPEFKESFSITLERQEIDIIDMWGEEKTAKLHMATTNFEQAITGVDYIMVAIPAIGHKRFFNSIIPYLEDGQTIVIWPGNYAALLFANMLREKGVKKNIIIAEAQTLPWGCRLGAPARIRIFIEVTRLLLGVYPAKNTDRVINDLRDIYPVVPAENVLATSLNSLNPIVHCVSTLLNTGWIDTLGKDFYLYKHGMTLSVARAIKAVYEEVAKVANAIDVKMIEYAEGSFWEKSSILAAYARVAFDKDDTSTKISGPPSMKHRYISEDVPYGLVPTAYLAHKFDVAIPIIGGIIELASVINQTDYRKAGRSLDELGIAGLSKDELKKALQQGF